jgi:type IV pilus biogenesis protein CpaD/CtpE
MKPVRMLSFIAVALSLAACSSDAPSSGQTVPNDVAPGPGTAAREPASTPAPVINVAETGDGSKTKESSKQAEWKTISLGGYSCGDNCYVEYTSPTEGSGDKTALCSAKICGEWERAGALPAALKGKVAEVKYGTAPRMDGGGNRVDDYRSIIDMRFPK